MNRPARYLFGSLFALIFASFLFNTTTAKPEWITSYHVIAMFSLFGGLGFAVYGYHVYGLTGRFGILLFTYLLSMLVLIGIVFQQMGAGFPNPGRVAKLTLVVLLFMFFISVCPRQSAFLKKAGVYLLAFGVLLTIHFYHVVPFAADSGSAAFPITAGFMMGLSVFVLPRYVSRDMFFWVLSVFSSFFVLIGLAAYYIGSYTFLGMKVQLYGSAFTPLLMSGQVTVLQSVFVNPNTFGILTFAGTVAAAILAHRLFPDVGRGREHGPVRADGASATVLSYPFVRSLGLFCLAGMMFAINAIGTYLSHSRACYLAVAISLALYLSYVSFGRRSLPYALAGLTGGFVLFLLFLTELGINPSGRFALWSGAVEAITRNPTLLGKGIVSPAEVIAPFVEKPYSGYSPHNSYLSLFIRAGLLGGIAYLVIIVGSIVSGIIRYEKIDVPSLALAFGFAIHQMFEVYSLFQHTLPSVIAALSFGYLILNGSLLDESETEESTSKPEPIQQRHSWSRSEWDR
jgi:hypothetical protein